MAVTHRRALRNQGPVDPNEATRRRAASAINHADAGEKIYKDVNDGLIAYIKYLFEMLEESQPNVDLKELWTWFEEVRSSLEKAEESCATTTKAATLMKDGHIMQARKLCWTRPLIPRWQGMLRRK